MERQISANSLPIAGDEDADLHRNRFSNWREGFDNILQTAPQILGLPPENRHEFQGESRFGSNISVITSNRPSTSKRGELAGPYSVNPSYQVMPSSAQPNNHLTPLPNAGSDRNGNNQKRHVVPVRGIPRDAESSRNQDSHSHSTDISPSIAITNTVSSGQNNSTPRPAEDVVEIESEKRTVLQQMMHEFDQHASIDALFNNRGRPGWIPVEEFDGIIVRLVKTIQDEASERMEDSQSGTLGTLFHLYATAQAITAQGYNDMRKLTCPAIDKIVQERAEVIEEDFGYGWLEKTVDDIQQMFNSDDPDTISVIRGLGGGLEAYYRTVKSERVNLLGEVITGLKHYETKLCNLLDLKVCVAEKTELKSLAEEFSQKLEVLGNQLDEDSSLKSKFTKVSEVIHDKIMKKNENRLQNETLIARRAAQHSVSKYCDFMERKLDKAITSKDLKALHDTVSDFIVESFFGVMDFVYTPPWEEKRSMLKQHMRKEFEEFVRKNEANVKLKDAEQESAIEECVTKFRRNHMKLLSEDMEGTEFHTEVQKLANQCLVEFQTKFLGFDKPAITRLQARINECIDSKTTDFAFVPIRLLGAYSSSQESIVTEEHCDASSNHLSYQGEEMSSPEELNMSPKLAEPGVTSPTPSSSAPQETDALSGQSLSVTLKAVAKPQPKNPAAASANSKAAGAKVSSTTNASTSVRHEATLKSSSVAAHLKNPNEPGTSSLPKTLLTYGTSAPSQQSPLSNLPQTPMSARVKSPQKDPRLSKPAPLTKPPASGNIALQSKNNGILEKQSTPVYIDRSTVPFGRIPKIRKESIDGTPIISPSDADSATRKRSSPAASPKVRTPQASPSSKFDQDPLKSPKSFPLTSPSSNVGVGFFFTESHVHVVVKVNQREETFSMTPILGFAHPRFSTPYIVDETSEEFKVVNSINVYKSITKPQFYVTPKKFWYDYTYEHLWSEEVIALFFLKMRKCILNRFQIDISGVVIAIALQTVVTSTCKRRLKQALERAGLKKSVFVQSTTAIGISYSLDSQRDAEEYGLAIYAQRNLVDVALIKYTGKTARLLAVDTKKTFLKIENGHRMSGKITHAIASVLDFAKIRPEDVKTCRTVVDIASLNPNFPNWDENHKFRGWFDHLIIEALPKHVHSETRPISRGMMKGLMDISLNKNTISADSFQQVFSCAFEISNIDGTKNEKIRLVSRNDACKEVRKKILASRLGTVSESSSIMSIYGNCKKDSLEMRLCATEMLRKQAPNAEIELIISEEGILYSSLNLKSTGQEKLDPEIAGRWKKDTRVMELENKERIDKRIKAIFAASPMTECTTTDPEPGPSKKPRLA